MSKKVKCSFLTQEDIDKECEDPKLETISNVCSKKIKEEPKDLGYQYDNSCYKNSNHQNEPIPSVSFDQLLQHNETEIASAPTQINIKNEHLDTSNSVLVVENPIYRHRIHNASDKISSNLTDQCVLAAKDEASCAVHLQENDVGNNSSHETALEIFSNINKESKKINEKIIKSADIQSQNISNCSLKTSSSDLESSSDDENSSFSMSSLRYLNLDGEASKRNIINCVKYVAFICNDDTDTWKSSREENRGEEIPALEITCQAHACDDQTICDTKYNTQVLSSSFADVSSKSSVLENKQEAHNETQITEYTRCKITHDPRLQKDLSSNTRSPNVMKIMQHNPTEQASQLLASVSAEVTPYNHESTSKNMDQILGQSFSSTHRICHGTVKRSVPTKYLFLHIIGWNARWLRMQNNTSECPKFIGNCEEVKDNYENSADYQNTYRRLHLLSIWLHMYQSWKNKPPYHEAELLEYEEKRHYFKNSCIAVMHSEDIPMHQSIIEVKCQTIQNKSQCLLGYVYRIKGSEHAPPDGSHRSGSWKRIIFSFYTIDKLDIKNKGIIEFCKLYKLRVADSQYDALGAIEFHPMGEVIINPKNHSHQIGLVHLPFTYYQNIMQTHIDAIINCATSPGNKFTLVIKESTADTLLPILKIARGFLHRCSTILICLTDIKRFSSLAELLCFPGSHEIVLGVKENEINLPEHLQVFTLKSHAAKLSKISLDKAELKVLRNSRIILTVLSSAFLSDNKNAILGQNLACIIEDAHLSTEAETALPLSFKPKNVVLLGIQKGHFQINSILKSFGYHRSLFERLYNAKSKH